MFKKTTVIVLTVLLFMCFSQPANARKNLGKRYDIKSGIVKYNIAGDNFNGTEELYFKDSGEIEARHTSHSVSFMGVKQETRNISLFQDGYMYNYDYSTNKLTKMDINDVFDPEEMRKINQSFKDFSKEMIKSMGGKYAGKEKILGKSADVIVFTEGRFKDVNMKAWVYKGVPLKHVIDIPMMGRMEYTATSFQENVSIPKDKLTTPVPLAQAEEMPGMDEMRNAMNSGGYPNAEMGNFKDAPADLGEVFKMIGEQKDSAELEAMQVRIKELEEEKAMREKLEQMEAQKYEDQIDEEQKNSISKGIDDAKGAVSEMEDIKNTFGKMKSLFNN